MNDYVEKLETQLDARESKIRALEAMIIDGPGADDYRRHMDNLTAKYAAARGKVNELKAEGKAKWEFYKTDIWIVWNELETAFQNFYQFVRANKGRVGNEYGKEQ